MKEKKQLLKKTILPDVLRLRRSGDAFEEERNDPRYNKINQQRIHKPEQIFELLQSTLSSKIKESLKLFTFSALVDTIHNI